MSEFSVKLNGLNSQSDILWRSYSSLRSCSSTIAQVTRALQTMTGFQTDIACLKRLGQRMETQYLAVRGLSRGLDDIADCYRAYENRALNEVEYGAAASRRGLVGSDTAAFSSTVSHVWNDRPSAEYSTASGNTSVYGMEIQTDDVCSQPMLSSSIVSLFTGVSSEI